EHSREADWPDTWAAVSFRIETATDIAACALTVPIQDEIWSGDVSVPPQLMLAVVHNGGFVALGYVDGHERPAGFVFGFLGIYDYHLRHHSHMLAVGSAPRGGGLAQALQEAQRDPCPDQGLQAVAWTMDPRPAGRAARPTSSSRSQARSRSSRPRTRTSRAGGASPRAMRSSAPSPRATPRSSSCARPMAAVPICWYPSLDARCQPMNSPAKP